MPYEYFDRYVFECWTTYSRPEELKLFKMNKLDAPGRVQWSARDEDDHRIYAFEVRDARYEERFAWAFVIERDGALEVEELYVRPEHRRRGYGGWLADCVAELAQLKAMAVRLWVGFADSKRENPANYDALVRTARRLGVRFQPCPVAWAAYYGSTEGAGAELPVEPANMPGRARAPLNEILSAVVALGMSLGPATGGGPPPSPPVAVPAEAVVEVGTPEWQRLTERRAELIYKKNREGLTAEEQAEFTRLQSASLAAINRAYPVPPSAAQQLADLTRRLGSAEDAPRP